MGTPRGKGGHTNGEDEDSHLGASGQSTESTLQSTHKAPVNGKPLSQQHRHLSLRRLKELLTELAASKGKSDRKNLRWVGL
jgi:hypothetical protein